MTRGRKIGCCWFAAAAAVTAMIFGLVSWPEGRVKQAEDVCITVSDPADDGGSWAYYPPRKDGECHTEDAYVK